MLISYVAHAQFEPGRNGKDRVVVTNLSSSSCKYLIRDERYGIHYSSFGHGYDPAGGSGGVALYVRGDGFAPATGNGPYMVAGAEYTAGSTAKNFFFGPVSYLLESPTLIG